MSNTISSALLIMRRVGTYLQDVDHILHHEIPNTKETSELVKEIKYSLRQLETINGRIFSND